MSENAAAVYGGWGFPAFVPPEPDPPVWPNCFICDLPATSRKSSWMFCDRHEEGVVRWSAYRFQERELKDSMIYRGETVPFVDFRNPSAPSAPA